MRAEVVAVGTELLLGDAVDTNSAWISWRLAEVGVDVFRHVTVGDNPARIAQVLREAAQRADCVIVTGGLGPTQDDLTREAVAEVASVRLERRPELVAHIRGRFRQRGRSMPERNLVQADLPAQARVLEPVGTAAGFVIELPASLGGARVYCLPGVPAEMRVMVDRDVVPDLVAHSGQGTTVSRLVRTAGMSESAVAEVLAPVVQRLDDAGNPTMAFLASKGETRVRITAKAASRDAALSLIAPVVDEACALLGAEVVGIDDEGPEHVVGRLLVAAGWRLATAESITAGGVGARLVQVAGASEWFAGGLVTYDAEAKERLAGVPARMLEEEGPVSELVVGRLALGARERVGTQVALAVVGVAGPTQQGGRPVGTICTAVALPEEPVRTRTVSLPESDRSEVQQWAAGVAIDQLRRDLAQVVVTYPRGRSVDPGSDSLWSKTT